MLKRITLENFFSFGKSTTIELNEAINVLVGINGSGKSNFLKAIQLLYEGIVGNGFQALLLKEWGGFQSIVNCSLGEKDFIKLTYEFDVSSLRKIFNSLRFPFFNNPIYTLIIRKSGTTNYYIEESVNAPEQEFQVLIQNGSIWGQEKSLIEQENFSGQESIFQQISDPERYAEMFVLKKAIEQIATYNYFDTTPNSKIRQPNVFTNEERLSWNGDNLISILNKLKNHHALDYEKIETYIKKVNPHFKDINFDFLGPNAYLVLREMSLSKSIPISHISDGTLRYLLLLAILFNPKRGRLVCLDEPEIGLHPDMIHSIVQAMKAAAHQGTQFFVATHSPLLLNDFEIEDLLIFEKDKDNQSFVNKKNAEDFEDDDYLTGLLWLNGAIGGKRW